MNPAEYDAWYASPRGRWIGETEFQLLKQLLAPEAGDNILDVGCGTGWFTRHFAALPGSDVTGIDPDPAALAFAKSLDAESKYIEGDGRSLPFADNTFERVASVTALCFISDWQLAIREIVRVTRKRFVIGLLNRNSLLWRDKGQAGGKGAYHGAHWHARAELQAAFSGLKVENLQFRTAIFMPSASATARCVEVVLPNTLPFGSFLVVSGEVAH
jgi:SAM-dependent methyltransferase